MTFSIMGCDSAALTESKNNATVTKEEKTNKNELKETKDKESTTEQQTTTSSQTMGQKNALKAAESYLGFMAFSYQSLVEQLEFDGYTHEEAVYGAEANGY
ncbi:Ltp family lipoprotein [Clostridium tepidum]